MEIKVLLTRKFFEQDIQYLKQHLNPDCKLIVPDSYLEEDLLKMAKDTDVFLGPVISEKLCLVAQNLKFIQIPWTGVDNLNFSEIEKIGVTVCNSHSNAYAVAEHAIALMMDVAKKIAYHDAELRRGNWNRPKQDGSNELSPFSMRVSNKNVGILGYGHIGKAIHEFLRGFKCTFYISDSSIKKSEVENGNFYFNPLHNDEFLNQVDFLFICVPLTNSTRGFINEGFISKLKKSAILINTSRGEVIDENALFEALKNGMICGAGIDTWYNYPNKAGDVVFPSEKNPFHTLNNLTLSPHRAAFIENELPHLDDAIMNLNRATEGKPPLNIISTKNKF